MTGANDSAGAYRQQQIMTAPPEQLTLMLYNGAIRFINESAAAIREKQIEKAHNANMRVQSILRELMATLDMQYDIAKQLMSVYDYMEYRLQSANIKKDISQLEEVRDLITELRDTWAEAIKKVQKERHAENAIWQQSGSTRDYVR
ncbi:MAG: flagellar export chaperone FliS [Sporomusaceae bacterium]|jgi:flagellar protein FliS|nr:flagellar export chaperone FliS [Sporomusaceae bacterium]